MAEADLLLTVGEELHRFVRPLIVALEEADAFEEFARDLGWVVDATAIDLDAVRDAFDLVADLSTLASAVAAATSSDVDVDDALALIEAFTGLVSTLNALASRPAPSGLPAGMWAAVASDLFDALLAEYLASYRRPYFALLILLGVVEVEQVVSTSADRVDYERRTLHWDRLQDGLSDPLAYVRTLAGWDGTSIDFVALLERLGRAAEALSLPVTVAAPTDRLRDQFYSTTNPDRNTEELRFSFVPPDLFGSEMPEVGFSLYPVPDGDPSASPSALRVGPAVRLPSILPDELPSGLEVEVSGPFIAEGIALLLSQSGVTLSTTDGSLDFSIALSPGQRGRRILIGSPSSHHIDYASWRAAFTVGGTVDDPEVEVSFALNDARLVVDPSIFDGFLGEVFGDLPPEITFEGEVTWSSKSGLRFGGSAGIRLEIPVDLTVGVVALDTFILSIEVDEEGLAIVPAVSGGLTLGPVAVVMEEVGIRLRLTPVSDGSGLFGNLDVTFEFKPPTGFGMVIDAGAVTGGGYLYLDPDAGRYAGILQLEIAGVVSVTAIGLLDTVMPDGSEGFSLLFIVAGEFPPIQLGYGFTLNGVGGLAGINRTIVTQALQDGVRTDAVDSILFPEDPVRDATQIISDLSTIFPPSKGQYLFGPMAIIGWGTPTLITGTIGIIIELPDPVRIVLLGQLDVVLPDEAAAIVSLHLDVVGLIDPEQQLISIDASLRDSSIATFAIAGDMAMRLTWGDSPSFALSVGGLHPEFQPPPGFPSLDRMSIALGTGDNPRLTLQAYLAVTSNTLQLGASADLYAEAGGFSLSGHVGFDTLIVFVPFSFSADLGATVALKRGTTTIASVRLEASLDGPSPWHARGEASVTVLCVDVSVPFDATFGKSKQNTEVVEDPWPLLKAAIEDSRNWSAVSATEVHPALTLTAPSSEAGVTLLDPSGAASLFERVLPLNREVSLFGNATVTGAGRYDVASVRLGDTALSTWETTKDYFAAAQFEEMSNSQRLSRPSFEQMDAGVAIGANEVVVGDAGLVATMEYETSIVDSRFTVRRLDRFVLDADRMLQFGRAGSAARSLFNTSGHAKYRAPVLGADADLAEAYVVVSTDDLSVRPSFFAGTGSAGIAAQTLATHLANHPEERNLWQVALAHEVDVTA